MCGAIFGSSFWNTRCMSFTSPRGMGNANILDEKKKKNSSTNLHSLICIYKVCYLKLNKIRITSPIFVFL